MLYTFYPAFKMKASECFKICIYSHVRHEKLQNAVFSHASGIYLLLLVSTQKLSCLRRWGFVNVCLQDRPSPVHAN